MRIQPILLGSMVLVFLAGSSAYAQSKPNVVLIISDDQSYTDYGFMGHKFIKTPNLDKLARQSRTFTHGYVPSSLCSPSLASILTGCFPHQHKVTSNDPPLPKGKTGAANRDPEYLRQRREMISYFEKAPTLPRLLANEGYVSFQTGKWWGGDYTKGGFTAGMTHGEQAKGGRHGDEGLKIGRQTMKPVTDFIDQASEEKKPFFVWYAPMLPHSPHNPPKRLLDKYKKLAPSFEDAKYWAMIEWFDETCGTLLNHLDDRKLADQTMVVFVADNGWIQDPTADKFAPRSKQSQYDGGLRTPIMVRLPGKVPPGISERPVSSVDIAPTILAAAGIQPEKMVAGINLLDDSALNSREAIFGEIFTHNAVDIHKPASSLRYRWTVERNWKLIVPSLNNTPDGIVELYDLAKDPQELKNLAGTETDRVLKMRNRLDAWWPGTE